MKRLTRELRAELKRPFGEVVDESELVNAAVGGKPLICIGDYCANVFLKSGMKPDIMVYDLKTMREPVGSEVRGRISKSANPVFVKSPPGTITNELVDCLKAALEKEKGDIFVDGEDDLAGLVAIAYAPEGAVVVYGMPSQGAVVVNVEREVREKALGILSRMES